MYVSFVIPASMHFEVRIAQTKEMENQKLIPLKEVGKLVSSKTYVPVNGPYGVIRTEKLVIPACMTLMDTEHKLLLHH